MKPGARGWTVGAAVAIAIAVGGWWHARKAPVAADTTVARPPPAAAAVAALRSGPPAGEAFPAVDERARVEQVEGGSAQASDPGALFTAARSSEACNLVRATLSEPAGGQGEAGDAPANPLQARTVHRLLENCSGFVSQPVAAEVIDAWYAQASRAGDVRATARLLALGRGFATRDAERDALRSVLAAAVPDTYPDLGQALKRWSGAPVVDRRAVPAALHDAAWQLAGCGIEPCGHDAFRLAYACALGGLCGAGSAAAFLAMGGLAPADVDEAHRLADVIRSAMARGEWDRLGFTASGTTAAR